MSAHVMTTSDRNAAIQASWGASVSCFKSLENEVSKVPAAQGSEGCQGICRHAPYLLGVALPLEFRKPLGEGPGF